VHPGFRATTASTKTSWCASKQQLLREIDRADSKNAQFNPATFTSMTRAKQCAPSAFDVVSASNLDEERKQQARERNGETFGYGRMRFRTQEKSLVAAGV